MAFSLSPAGFIEFLTRPFTNVIGIIFLIGAGFYIYLRLTGKIGPQERGGKGKGGQGRAPDYIIR